MKKIIAIILTLAFAASLTACSKTPSEGDPSSDSSNQPGISQTDSNSTDSSDSEPDSSDSTDNSDSTGSSDSEPISSDVRALIDAFPEEEFTAPDGSILKRSDAVKAAEWEGITYAVGYDFSYIRYAQPVWGSTVDDPNFINWDTMETAGDPLEFPQDAKYFKVKAGDKLENGLTVKKAEYYYGRGMDGTTYDNNVEFDGELSLEGILYYFPGDTEYGIANGDTLFFADPAKYDKIPMPLNDFMMLDGFTDTDVKFSVKYDGERFQLGNVDTLPDSVSQLLKEKNAIRVRVTLRNIKFRLTPCGEIVDAEIVSAEKV